MSVEVVLCQLVSIWYQQLFGSLRMSRDYEQAGDFELVEIVNDEKQDAMVQCLYHLQVHLCLI